MKKYVYFLAFSLLIGCQKYEKQNIGEAAVSQEMVVATDTTSVLRGVELGNKNLTSRAKNAEKARTEQANTDKNVFALSQYATTSRKMVWTAQVKTKVEHTEKATYQIEQFARKWQGFVTSNNLESRVKKQEEVQISADSMLQVTHSEAVNTLCVRVPTQNLDTFLMEISRIYTHLDYRRVNSEDLTGAFLTNQLKAELRNQSSQRIAAATDAQGKRLNDVVDAEVSRVQLSDEAIAQKVQNVETDYDIAYSTVNIEIYEDVVVSKNTVPSMATVRASFGVRCQQAFVNGWSFLLDVCVGILNLWVFILIGFLGYALYRRMAGSVFPKLALARKE